MNELQIIEGYKSFVNELQDDLQSEFSLRDIVTKSEDHPMSEIYDFDVQDHIFRQDQNLVIKAGRIYRDE